MNDPRDLRKSERRQVERRTPALTPGGEILVEVTLTEDVWLTILEVLNPVGPDPILGRLQVDATARAAIEASVRLARHHATNGLTSAQSQAYIDEGIIVPVEETFPVSSDEALDRLYEYALDEAAAIDGSIADTAL